MDWGAQNMSDILQAWETTAATKWPEKKNGTMFD